MKQLLNRKGEGAGVRGRREGRLKWLSLPLGSFKILVESKKRGDKTFMVSPRTKIDVKPQVSSSRSGALKDARSRLLFRATLRVVSPPWVPFVSGAAPSAGEDRRVGIPRPPAAEDQGCLLLSTPSSTSITRARPLAVQSARWESPPFHGARTATGWSSCQSSGHPARMQQEYWERDHQSGGGVTFPINKMCPPPRKKAGVGASKHYPAPGPHWSGAG